MQKGLEYQSKLNDDKLRTEISALKKIGGKIKYLGKYVKSSSDILSKNFNIDNQEFKNLIKPLNKINIEKELENSKRLRY